MTKDQSLSDLQAELTRIFRVHFPGIDLDFGLESQFDSISITHLIVILEKEYHIDYHPNEVDIDNFKSVQDIAITISKKIKCPK